MGAEMLSSLRDGGNILILYEASAGRILQFEEVAKTKAAALLTTVQDQQRGRRGVTTSSLRRWTEKESVCTVTEL